MLKVSTALFLTLSVSLCLGGPLLAASQAETQIDIRIRPFDKLDVVVNDEPELSGAYTGSDRGFDVDARGFIQYPFLGKVFAAGLTTEELQEYLRLALSKDFVRDPQVRVRFSKNSALRTISLLGRVKKPGNYEVTPGATAVKMISAAGGFFRDADIRNVVLTRQREKGPSEVIPLDVERILKGEIPDVPTLAGDSIYIPRDPSAPMTSDRYDDV